MVVKIVKFIFLFSLLNIEFVYSNIDEERARCYNETSILVSSILNQLPLPDEYNYVSKFFVYSGNNLNELGNYADCNRIPNGKYFLMYYQSIVPINIGFCYFKSCDKDYLNSLKVNISTILSQYTKFNLSLDSIFFDDPVYELEQVREKYSTTFLCSMIMFSVLLIFSVLISIFSINSEENHENLNDNNLVSSNSAIINFLNHFNLSRNFNKIISVNDENSTNSKIRVLDGVRFFCISCVVIGHAFFLLLFVKVKNINEIVDFLKSFRGAYIQSYRYSVDIFFFLSGFLFTINIQKFIGKKIDKIKIICQSILMRYLRLFPLYAFVIFILVNSLPYMSSGPFYSYVGELVKNCQQNWWLNFLYINNFVKSDMNSMCISHSWYLANDFQFFILSLLVYIIFNNNRKIRNILFCSFLILSFLIQFILIFVYEIRYLRPNNPNEWNIYYIKPWCRITPYILGIYFAELYLNISNEEVIINKNEAWDVEWMKIINLKLHKSGVHSRIATLIGILCIIYGIIIDYIALNFEVKSLFLSSFYYITNKIIFTFGVGLLLNLTYLNKLEYLKDFLSLKIFTVIGRVSFGIYLVHILVIIVYYFGSSTNIYFNYSEILFLGISFLVISFILSIFISVLVESPIVNMIKPKKEVNNK